MKQDILARLRDKAKVFPKKIILPEGKDGRIICAAKKILQEEIARLIIFGDNKLKSTFTAEITSGRLEIVDTQNSAVIDKYASLYFQLRKHKGIDLSISRGIITEEPVYVAALMVKEGLADGFVAGASISTSDVARAAMHCIGRREGISTVLGVFIMIVPESSLGENGTFIFSDCAVVPQPNIIQLSDIASETADFTKNILNIVPRVAMLSYSTKGSSSSERINVIAEATKMVNKKTPSLLIDGELQVDAAIFPAVAKLKAPDSKVAGSANVLIFPNLEAANCGYKLVQRLARARAVGPIFLGLAKSASDLSRGCDVDDIVDTVAVTVVCAQQ